MFRSISLNLWTLTDDEFIIFSSVGLSRGVFRWKQKTVINCSLKQKDLVPCRSPDRLKLKFTPQLWPHHCLSGKILLKFNLHHMMMFASIYQFHNLFGSWEEDLKKNYIYVQTLNPYCDPALAPGSMVWTNLNVHHICITIWQTER